MAKCLTYIGLFLLGLTSLSAQKSSLEQSVAKLFVKPEKVLWLRHYNGTVDDVNDVSIVLAYDGKMCKGRMKYLKSKAEFGLVGFMKNQKIRLLEVDRQTSVSGFMEGRMNGKELLLDWSSSDNSIASRLVLKESPKEIHKAKSECGKEKWIRTFRGLLGNQNVEFLLQLEAENQLRGLAFFNKDQRTYEVKGEINKGDEINITLTDHYKKTKGSLRGHITQRGIVEAVFLNPYGARTKSNFWEHETLEVGCMTYIDYISSFDVSYPRSTNSAFNKWMLNLVTKEKNDYEDYIKKAQELGQELNPETRASIRTHGWYDVDFLSVNIISGTLWLSNSWQEKENGISFNFDLNSGKSITQNTIFKRDFNLQDFIWAYISEDIQEHKYYDDYDFRKWLSTASFKTFTIRNEGINFSTPFNAIYGQQQITIPFEVLKPHMQPQNPIWNLTELKD